MFLTYESERSVDTIETIAIAGNMNMPFLLISCCSGRASEYMSGISGGTKKYIAELTRAITSEIMIAKKRRRLCLFERKARIVFCFDTGTL